MGAQGSRRTSEGGPGILPGFDPVVGRASHPRRRSKVGQRSLQRKAPSPRTNWQGERPRIGDFSRSRRPGLGRLLLRCGAHRRPALQGPVSKGRRRRRGRGQVILSTGFNGFPRGIRELRQRTREKEEKYAWITHAETNAIFNAARSGVPLVGSTLYVTTFPCCGCAQAIVQSGIRRVFTLGEYWTNDRHGYQSRRRFSPRRTSPLTRRKSGGWTLRCSWQNASGSEGRAQRTAAMGQSGNPGSRGCRK